MKSYNLVQRVNTSTGLLLLLIFILLAKQLNLHTRDQYEEIPRNHNRITSNFSVIFLVILLDIFVGFNGV